ncbi:hypothetical protein HYFRA_00012857 [Hymenoscyphus fraxineus]|uniref:2EXR domain-containing protein n=1 Tax=Hymenoscyphus fraxineus TaxID=746836 RepID=A0A9N9PTF3_9HELO|nr:hypothetical protein HYFRA_00012857 [Hymenoscyphus fraxineus]
MWARPSPGDHNTRIPIKSYTPSCSLYDRLRWRDLIREAFINELPDADGLLSLHTFIYFKELPIELRWRIWEATLPGPRLVHVYCLEQQILDKEHLDIINSPPPVAHAVNKESRDFVLREYQRIPILMDFRVKDYGSLLFSPKMDTLHMSWGHCLLFIQPGWDYDYRPWGDTPPNTTSPLTGWEYTPRNPTFPLTPCPDHIKTFLSSIRRLELTDFTDGSLKTYNSEEFRTDFQFLNYLRSVEDVKLVGRPRRYYRLNWNDSIDYISQTLHSLYMEGSITKMPTITTWKITPPHHPKFEQLPRPIYSLCGGYNTRRYISIEQVSREGTPLKADDEDDSEKVHERESAEQQEKNAEQDNDQEENRLAPEPKDSWWKGPIPEIGNLPEGYGAFPKKLRDDTAAGQITEWWLHTTRPEGGLRTRIAYLSTGRVLHGLRFLK